MSIPISVNKKSKTRLTLFATKALVAQTLFDKDNETDDKNDLDLSAGLNVAKAIPSFFRYASKGIYLVRTIYKK